MSVKDFTKGGQTFGQNVRMFMAVFGKLVSVFGLVFTLSFLGSLYLKTTAFDRYKLKMAVTVGLPYKLEQLIGHGLEKIGLASSKSIDDLKPIAFQLDDGETLSLTPEQMLEAIVTKPFIAFLKHLLLFSALQAFLLGLIADVLIAKWLIGRGQKISSKTVLRGNRVCELKELVKCIRRHNKGQVSELDVAGVPLPYGSETQHIWINGTTGSGKTVAFSNLMQHARQKGRKAIVYCNMGTYVERFYRPGKDHILNAFDKRGKLWAPWAECRHSVDYEMLAASQIPIAPGVNNEDPFWKKAARSLYATTLRRLKNEGKANNVTLLRYLLTADLDKLRALLVNTEAESLGAKDLEKTALSVKAILTNYIKGLRFMKDDGALFSIRDWIENDDDSWLFIATRSDYHETLIPLISTWYDIVITSALTLPKNEARRVYCFIDELASLQYLPALHKGMTQGRQKGLCFVIGTQDIAQLRVNYGPDYAKSIIGNTNTKLILRTTDDAESIAGLFSQAEIEENQESISFGVNDNRDGVSVSTQHKLENIILPSELQSLDNLEGYLRVAGNFPITKIKQTYIEYPKLNEGLIPIENDVDWLVAAESTTWESEAEELEYSHRDGLAPSKKNQNEIKRKQSELSSSIQPQVTKKSELVVSDELDKESEFF